MNNIKLNNSKTGLDIVISLDISKSMEANDILPSRIEVAKSVLTDFISKNKDNRIGLVIFAGKTINISPLSFEYKNLISTIKSLTTDSINQISTGYDGTAIGDSLLLSNQILLNSSKTKSKVIILITDGETNKGIDPIIATNHIKKDNIKIYTIGIGTNANSSITINNGGINQKIDVGPLKADPLIEISSLTNSKFYKATTKQELGDILFELEKLEKSKIEYNTAIHNFDLTKYLIYFEIFLLLLYSCLIFIFFTKEND